MSFNDFREKINANSHRVVVLDELAGQVRAAHQEVRAARQAVRMTESNALDSAIAAGVALLVIQGRVGSMKDWTAKNLREIGSSTLKLYMQLARGRDKIEAARKDAPFLSIREARQLLTTKRRSKQEPEQEEDPELTDVQLIRQLTARGLDWLLKNLPEDWRIEFLNRLRGPVLRAAQREHPNTRLKNLNLRLVHSSDRPTKH